MLSPESRRAAGILLVVFPSVLYSGVFSAFPRWVPAAMTRSQLQAAQPQTTIRAPTPPTVPPAGPLHVAPTVAPSAPPVGPPLAGPPATPDVVPDLAQRLAKFRRVSMPFHSAGLTPRERQMTEKLVAASQFLEDIFWRQSDPGGLALLRSLDNSKNPADVALRRYLMINGSRFDLIHNNEPFVGQAPMPPGRGLYPPGLTRAEIEAYVRDHPDQKPALYDPHTVVRRDGARLVAVPYHVV